MSPWAPQSSNKDCGKTHFGGTLPRRAMRRLQSPHRSAMCREAHVSAYTPLPSSFFLLIRCQAATKDSKGLSIFPYGRGWLLSSHMEEGGYYLPTWKRVVTGCFPVRKQNQTNHSFPRVCPGNMHFWSEVGDSFRREQHLVLKLPRSTSSCGAEFKASK